MTKINSCQTFIKLNNTNIIDLKISEWVERVNERKIKDKKITKDQIKDEEIIEDQK
jgi:hypothetical protein